MEDEIELRWEEWLDDAATWAGFFQLLASCSTNLETELLRAELVTGEDIERIRKLRRGAEQRAVPVPGEFSFFYRDPELVKGCETDGHADLMSASGLGSLIQATVGSLGGVGRRWRNLAGLAA